VGFIRGSVRAARLSRRPNDQRGRRRHVLIVVENVPASMDHRVSKQIQSLVASGFRVSVVTRRHPRNRNLERDYGAHVLGYPPPPDRSTPVGYVIEYGYSLFMATLQALRSRLRGRIDVVQLCQPPDIYVVLGLLMRALGAAIVVDQRDLLPELYSARYGEGHRRIVSLLGRMERLSQRFADHVLCVNDYLREKAIRSSGLSPDRVSVVRNGPVLSRVRDAGPDRTLKRQFPFLCCWVGMIAPQDRVDLLLSSIDHLVHVIGRDDCAFALIGAGDSLSSMTTLAHELDLERWVTFTGWLPEHEVFRYLATADVGLDSTLQAEVSPVKAMEYMAFGLPLAAFDLLETRNTAAGAGSYSPPGDTTALARNIDALLSDTSRRRAMSEAGRRRVEADLAWERQAVSYLGVIGRLPETTSRRARRIRHPGEGV
jgi:glycosyltransferase involved in cell wall biosynthesis